MQRFLLAAPLILSVLLGWTTEASAQCVTIGARICQGGYWYYCRSCGSEKCWIASSERCLRDETFEEDEPRSRVDLRSPERLSLALLATCLRAPGAVCTPGVARRQRLSPQP